MLENPSTALFKGMLIMAVGIACYLAAIQCQDLLDRNDYITLSLLGMVVWIHGSFIGARGLFRPIAKPVSPYCLLLYVPIPILSSTL